ncbi:MAG: hypothetical protein KOO60_05590 [Gemmatimonadales bacterium]|nr:hypothetical protein [Gemmatimonadales bacterium]
MLRALRVGNLALVDELEIQVGTGLTMVTGETGAGKSLIAGALSLLAGGKATKGMVRHGTDLAFVEGVFDLGDRPADREDLAALGIRIGSDGVLVLRRELKIEGRGRTLINGLFSSQALLEQIGKRLLSVQSQDQQRHLSRSGFAGEFLDRALGLEVELAEMENVLAAYLSLAEDLANRRREDELAREQLDIWEYQLRELSEAGLDTEEPALLTEQLALGRNARALLEGAASCRQDLTEGEGNAQGKLGSAEVALASLADGSPGLSAILAMIRDALANTSEAAADLERFLDNLDLDPARLDEMEERKALYDELCRKYRRDVPELINLRDDLAQRLKRQGRAASDLEELATAVEQARGKVANQAEHLYKLRRDGAPEVVSQATAIIRRLALPDLELEFSVELDQDPSGWLDLGGHACRAGKRGADRVELLARTNRGEAPGRVSQIASGGERSRIFLGLSVIGEQPHRRPLLLFDEIDAGLGMDNAVPVAELLERLAADGQVFCITHLPTVACRGHSHWKVYKKAEGDRTVLRVEELDPSGRVRETARLLGGEAVEADVSESQLNYARQLLSEGRRHAVEGGQD